MEYYVGYIPFLVLFVAASGFGIVTLALASVLRPKFRPGPLRTGPLRIGNWPQWDGGRYTRPARRPLLHGRDCIRCFRS